jgi:hypothetical protein
MKYFSFSLFLVLVCLLSCTQDQEAPRISPSVDLIEMEAEGGVQPIEFTTGNWIIDRVENVISDTKIFGDIYSLQNERLHENVLLGLEDEGMLEAIWLDKGFTIVRNEQDKLEIRLNENSSGEQFGFRIILTSESDERVINVSQKASQGYEFKQIDYYLEEGDGDSLYWRNGTTMNFNIQTSQEIEFTPIGGIDVNSTYNFISEVPDAFVWLETDSVQVKIPVQFQDGEIYFAQEKGLYTAYVQSGKSDFSEIKETITVDPGYSEYRSEFEMRRRISSYSLLLINNRTKEEKTIRGKLVQIAPTGKFSIIKINND